MERGRVHRLAEIVTIALCGADDWVAIEALEQEKEGWPRTFLEMPGGIPSHDTFGWVFARLDPDEFRGFFLALVRTVVDEVGAQVVAVDGQTLRGSHDRAAGKEALHLVSSWATASGLVLGQVATDAKSNEITAIPHMLRLIDLDGATVTIDAMGCQTAVAAQIIERGADYVLALKANQHAIHDLVGRAFHDVPRAAGTSLPLADLTPTVTHGRNDSYLRSLLGSLSA